MPSFGDSYFQDRVNHLHQIAQGAMGTEIVFRPLGNPADDFEITGILDRRYIEINGVQSSHPISGNTVSDIYDEIGRNPSKGDQLLVGSTVYDIIEFHPDGHDDSKLILHEVT